MEQKYRLLLVIFVLIILLTLAGFFRSYLSHFTDFKGGIHLHFLAFCCWFLLTVLQPILIRKNKVKLHRKLGKISYFLIPLLVITIVLLRLEKLKIADSKALPELSFETFITLMDIISLCGFYLIAVLHAKNIRWHVAFILATTLVVFNPGLARLLNIINPALGMLVIFVPLFFTITVFLVEKFKLKRPILKSPYFLFFILWVVELGLVITIPTTSFWQNIVRSLMG